MIIICEECGKKYQIDPSRIKTSGAKAKCTACGNMMTIPKPQAKPEAKLEARVEAKPEAKREARVEAKPKARPPEPPPALRPTREIPARGEEPPPPKEEPPSKIKEARPEAQEAAPKAKKKGMGLRFKIFLLFFLIPIILFVGAGYLYLRQLANLSDLITQESTKAVTQLGEQIIAEKARSVAEQVRLYLLSHPNLRKEDYNNDKEFRPIAVQKVGLTGYTALYAVPDKDGVWRTWAHDNPKIVAIDMSTLKGPMGKNFPGFWRVFSSAKDGKESRGYYTWQEKDGSFRDKYMVCAPVKGTPYNVAATTYLDEFTRPVKEMERKASDISADTRNIVLGILAGTLLLIGIIVALYGTRLTSRIKKLTSVAEQISVGEMDAEIPETSQDEIGDLAEAIRRMQESIRLSIERLRRRR
jgi:HAMP domain-containing protein